jgi:hypothetical protein
MSHERSSFLIIGDMTARNIAPATGKLGVLMPGMGAVASTFIAGVIAARHGTHPPIGSLTQMAHIRLGKREENRNPQIQAGKGFWGWHPGDVLLRKRGRYRPNFDGREFI